MGTVDRRKLILSHPDIPASHKLVATALMDAERENGMIVVQQQALATFFGIQRPYVTQIISDLVKWGVIEKFRIEDPTMWDGELSYKQNAYRFIGAFAAPYVIEPIERVGA